MHTQNIYIYNIDIDNAIEIDADIDIDFDLFLIVRKKNIYTKLIITGFISKNNLL